MNSSLARLWSAIVVLVFVAVFGREPANGGDAYASEQSHFSAEEAGVQRPIPIPEGVLAFLRKDKTVTGVLEHENVQAEKLPLSWFSASAIHLSTPEKTDVVVLGETPVSGGNTMMFWIFCSTAEGYQLALTGAAHDLAIKPKRWKGYREIEVSGETAATLVRVLYRFDGKRYTAYREKSQHIR